MKPDRKEQAVRLNSLYKKMQLVHEIQTIYFGNLNQSYQKQSYGILQSIDFQTYIGGFKNNKAQGLGLVLFPTGQTIYGNFQRDQLNGIGVIDIKGDKLKCGVFEKMEMVGVGFEYTYETKIWKMCKFFKGIAVQVIKQQLEIRQGTPPKIMHFQQNIYSLLNNYFNKKFFPVSVYQEEPDSKINPVTNKPIVVTSQAITQRFYHQISVSSQFYGYKDSGGYFGPGVLFQNQRIKAIGFFIGSFLHGYGIKYQPNDTVQIGLFINGKKDGIFLERSGKKQKFFEYQQNKLISEHPTCTLETIKKKQKKYNYQSKDFFSSKQTFNFYQLEQLFIPSQVRAYQATHNQPRHSISPDKNKFSNPMLLSSPTKEKKQSKSPKGGKKQQKPSYLILQKQQKSSVQIMKQKIMTFTNVISDRSYSAKSVKWKQDTKRQLSRSPRNAIDQHQSQDESIANQENPFFI